MNFCAVFLLFFSLRNIESSLTKTPFQCPSPNNFSLILLYCCHFDTNFVMCKQRKNKISTEEIMIIMLNVCIYNYYYYYIK